MMEAEVDLSNGENTEKCDNYLSFPLQKHCSGYF